MIFYRITGNVYFEDHLEVKKINLKNKRDVGAELSSASMSCAEVDGETVHEYCRTKRELLRRVAELKKDFLRHFSENLENSEHRQEQLIAEGKTIEQAVREKKAKINSTVSKVVAL